MKRKFSLIVCLSLLIAFLGLKAGFSPQQAIAAGVFCMSILGVLIFWELRLSFVFFGAGILLITRVVDLENLIRFASLDVIFFLIGMMILVAMLNDVGFFYWIITRLLRIKNLTGEKLFILLMAMSAVLAGLMDEVSSIIVMTKIILDITDFLDIDPKPLILASVLATNIGSSGTVLGNPIGILIAARAKLTFEDFVIHALPITLLVLVLTIGILSFWFRKTVKQLTEKLAQLKDNTFFFLLIKIPTDRKTKISIGLFSLALACIVMHRRFESMFALEENTLLMIMPIFFAGIAMIYRRDRVRYYIEHGIAWMSVLFFLFLFALAGVMKYSGISDIIAKGIITKFGQPFSLLSGIMMYSSGMLSAVLDNTVVVASYIPVIQSLGDLHINLRPLWWIILFGACYGGNITVIGSTANMVAIDILEKTRKVRISFLEWFKIGIIVGLVSMTISYFLVLLMNR